MTTNLASGYDVDQCDFCGEESDSTLFISMRIVSLWIFSESGEKHLQQEEYRFCSPECIGKHFKGVGSEL